MRGTNQTETSYEISLRNKVGLAMRKNDADRQINRKAEVETDTGKMGKKHKKTKSIFQQQRESIWGSRPFPLWRKARD